MIKQRIDADNCRGAGRCGTLPAAQGPRRNVHAEPGTRIDQDRPLAARTGRVYRRVATSSAAVEVPEASTEGSGESATGQRRRRAMCSRHDPLWTTADVAAFLTVPVQTIYDWRTRGYGPPGFRLGKHLRFRESDVFAWLDRMTRPVA
jgi:predicted DNA-binding transcriptional regulator AlpA